jgi:hypothetical protein
MSASMSSEGHHHYVQPPTKDFFQVNVPMYCSELVVPMFEDAMIQLTLGVDYILRVVMDKIAVYGVMLCNVYLRGKLGMMYL